MARRSDYTRLLRWLLDNGYSLADLTGTLSEPERRTGRADDYQENAGGVRSGDFMEWDRKTAKGNDMKIPAGAWDQMTAMAREWESAVRRQAETDQPLRLPRLRGEGGRFEAWSLSAEADHQLRQELTYLYRATKLEGRPPSLRAARADRQGAALIKIEGIGQGNVRSPERIRWGNVLKERQTRLTREIRAADRAAATKRTAPARERAADRAAALRAEREAVKNDRRQYPRR